MLYDLTPHTLGRDCAKTPGYRVTTSWRVLGKALQMLIIISDDDQHTLADAGLTWLGDASLLADQLGNGRVIARNDQFLAREFTSETFVCRRLSDYNVAYATRSASPTYADQRTPAPGG
jgi:hypothetical protein